MVSDPLALLKVQQQAWAARVGIQIDKDWYTLACDANLFEPLSACARRDLTRGDGSELGNNGGRGKIQALHSSAALACNFFDYWRGRDLGILERALGIPSRLCGLAFEQKFPTRLGGIAPNMDVVLYRCDGGIVAIESKFTEPFVKSKAKSFLKPKYFPAGRGLWEDAGLLGCQSLAHDLRDGRVRFEVLDVAQLLKHMLGLARNCHDWSLVCLWYSPGGMSEEQHSEELKMFSDGTNRSRLFQVSSANVPVAVSAFVECTRRRTRCISAVPSRPLLQQLCCLTTRHGGNVGPNNSGLMLDVVDYGMGDVVS